MRHLILIAHNIRSAHNVGSLLRTADGLGVEKVYLTGYTPFPSTLGDPRLPHLAAKINRAIAKTALGAEKSVNWQQTDRVESVISRLKKDGYEIAALEQAIGSVKLNEYQPPQKVAMILGSEVGGIEKNVLKAADVTLEISMSGTKESFNVAAAAAMALFYLRLPR